MNRFAFRPPVLYLVVGVLAGCAAVPTEPALRLIVTPAQADTWASEREIPPGLDGPYWHPPDSLVRRVDRALLHRLPSVSTPRPDGLRGIDGYGIQYLGYTRDGRRLVHANGFCVWRSRKLDPREHWLVTFDGGGCFFGATYDPVEGRLVGFDSNTNAD